MSIKEHQETCSRVELYSYSGCATHPRQSHAAPAVTNVFRATRFFAQGFAGHVSPLTTVIYTHPADEELAEGVRDLPC